MLSLDKVWRVTDFADGKVATEVRLEDNDRQAARVCKHAALFNPVRLIILVKKDTDDEVKPIMSHVHEGPSESISPIFKTQS